VAVLEQTAVTRSGAPLAAALLLALAVGCGSGSGGQDKGGAPPEQKQAGGDGFATTWLGLLSRTYDGDLALCVDTVKASLRKLDIEVSGEEGGIFERTLEAESRDGTSLIVIVKEVTKGTTRVGIKVGYLLGDRDAARRIHSEIEAELGLRRAEDEKRRRRWAGGARPGETPPAQPGP
jgi:hypothetical protein